MTLIRGRNGRESGYGAGPEPQKNYRGKSPRNRLLDRVKQLDSLSRNKELKLAKLADVQLEIASLERLLYNDSREDRNSETLTELATATQQLTRANAEIARLTQANAELRASQQPVRVEIQQDPTISTFRADNAAKGDCSRLSHPQSVHSRMWSGLTLVPFSSNS